MIIKKLVLNTMLLFNYENDTYAIKSKLANDDEKNFIKMHRLKVLAQKNMTFVEGKNRQENARLKNITNLL